MSSNKSEAWKKCPGCNKYCRVVACKDPKKENFGKAFWVCPEKSQDAQCKKKDGKNLWIGECNRKFLDMEPPAEDETESRSTGAKSSKSKKKSKREEEEEEEQQQTDPEEEGLSDTERKERARAKVISRAKKTETFGQGQTTGLEPIYASQSIGKSLETLSGTTESMSFQLASLVSKVDTFIGVLAAHFPPNKELQNHGPVQ